MATANRAYFSWIGTGGSYFPPGGTHDWWMVGFNVGDALSVTAYPVIGDPRDLHRVLQVENIRMDGDPGGWTFRFRVHNIGTTHMPGYGVGIAWTSH